VTKRRTILTVILGVLALGAAVRADMMPVGPSPGEYGRAAAESVATAVPEAEPLVAFTGGGIADFPVLPVASGPAADEDAGQVRATKNVPILTDGQTSFSLCLYALLGLGLCRSVPLVKKVSLGYIPQWYHDGGPVQVGHSFAISPDCLCAGPVCFVQPEGPAEDPIPRYHFPDVVSRWRDSQFTPMVRASRAPPSSSR
jgi:hypothetical protein